MRTKIASLCLLASLGGSTAWAQASAAPAKAAAPPSAEKAADIQKLLEITGAARMGEQMIDRLMALQQQSNPDVPPDLWNELRASMDAGELGALISGVWDRHFTHEDIRGLIAFYESPLGVRLIAAQPMILQESMAVGEAWGRRSAEKVFEKLKQKGFPPKKT